MAGTLTFPIDDRFKSMVEHARQAKEHRPTYGETNPKPALWLVKDTGVYLMSNGAPMQQDPNVEKPKAIVCYAKEANAETMEFEEVWEASRSIMGGDDGCDALELATFEKAIEQGVKSIKIKVTAKALNIIF